MALLTKAPAPKRAKPDPESAVPGDDPAGSTRAGGVEPAPATLPPDAELWATKHEPRCAAFPRRYLPSIPKRAKCARPARPPRATTRHRHVSPATLSPPRRRTEADIVVAKKKLDALREWLRACDRPGAPRVVLVVGPSGCGKTAAVRLVAAEAGRDVHEWRPPVPTLWDEFKHANAPGVAYSSKVDDFAAFVQRASRYSPLGLAPVATAETDDGRGRLHQQQHPRVHPDGRNRPRLPAVLLVEDLPVGGTDESQTRVSELLQRLARESRAPACVILAEDDDGPAGGGGWGGGASAGGARGGTGGGSSTGGGGGGGGGVGHVLSSRRLSPAMEAAGALVLAFNPATQAKLAKALAAVARAEGLDVTPARLAEIAAAAEGDVRCAIGTLQLMASGRTSDPGSAAAAAAAAGAGKKRRTKKERDAAAAAGGDGAGTITSAADAGVGRRDTSLSLFHALGKILYNKRGAGGTPGDTAADAAADGVTRVPPDAPRPDEASASASERAGARADTSGASPSASGRGRDGTMRFGVGAPPFAPHPRFAREPMSYDPEGILARAHFGAEQATAFLFENFLEGLRDDAVEDAAIGTAYLSDAALLARGGYEGVFLGGAGGGGAGSAGGNTAAPLMDGDGVPADPGAVGELVAGSLATRGLLFAPAPSRPALRGFRAFRGPQSARANRAAVANLREVRAVVAAAAGGDFSVGSDANAAAAETLPMLRVMASCGPEGAARVPYLPARWVRPGEEPGAAAAAPPGVRCAPRPGQASVAAGGRGGHAIGGADVVDRRVGGAALAGNARLAAGDGAGAGAVAGAGPGAPLADPVAAAADEMEEEDDDIEEW